MPPAGIFGARRKGGALAATPLKGQSLSPCAVIGIPACTALTLWPTLVKKGLLLFLLAENILAEGIRPLHPREARP